MAECELCGRKIQTSVEARIGGVLLDVCSECAKSGTIVDRPKPKPMRPIQQLRVQPEELVTPDFSQKIRQARQSKGLKQEEVANAINEKLSVISAVESGKRTPNLKFARKLEKFYGIELIDLE